MRVGVIGGGLAGLVAAFDLTSSGAQVLLYNDTVSLGGQIRTRRDGGFVIEDGAEGWVAADTDVPELCALLGIHDDLVLQLERRSLYLSRGKLTELKSGDAARLLGIPAKDSDLGAGIASLRGGMATLTDSLALNIRRRSTWKLGEAVIALEPRAGGWQITRSVGDGESVDAIVVAVPARALAGLLDPLANESAQALRQIEFASNVSVSLGYESAAVGRSLDASGFVVDAGEQLEGLRACAFSSTKLPGRAAAHRVLVRAFFRPDPARIGEDDATWSERAARLLSPVLEITRPPLGTWVARWPEALPQYTATHHTVIEKATRELQRIGRIQLAGTSYHPSGIPGAVRSGRSAARAILES